MSTKVSEAETKAKVSNKVSPLNLGEGHRVVTIPVENIKINWDNNRRTQLEAEESLAVLKQAVATSAKHMVAPILVRQLGEDQYELEDGFRRMLVCEKLDIKEVPAYVLPKDADKTDVELLKMSLNSSEARYDINDMARLDGLLELMDKCQKRGDANVEVRVRKTSGISKSRWDSLMRLKLAPPAVKAAVRSDRLSLSAALAFWDKKEGKFLSNDAVLVVLEKAPKTNTSAGDIQAAIQVFKAKHDGSSPTANTPVGEGEIPVAIPVEDLYLGGKPLNSKQLEVVMTELSLAMLDVDTDLSVSVYDKSGKLDAKMLAGIMAGVLMTKGRVPPPMEIEGFPVYKAETVSAAARWGLEYEIFTRTWRRRVSQEELKGITEKGDDIIAELVKKSGNFNLHQVQVDKALDDLILTTQKKKEEKTPAAVAAARAKAKVADEAKDATK